MTQYQRGQRIQYKARNELRQKGYHTMISSRSLGPFDLIAWRSNIVRFVQVKSCQREKFYFKKDELGELEKEEIPKFCRKEVWIWFGSKKINNYFWRKWECVQHVQGKKWRLVVGQGSLEKKLPHFHLYPKPF